MLDTHRETGLHLDIGRKSLPASWIVDLLHHMAGLGLTTLQLHVSENLGYRLPSKRRPEIVSGEHLTAGDLRDIGQTADGLGLRLVPSLDLPGHFAHILERYPALRLDDGHGGVVPAALDLENADARELVADLLDDVGEHFADSDEWHLGFDEIVPMDEPHRGDGLAARARARLGPEATSHDLVTLHANELTETLARRGVGVRLWNDALLRSRLIELDPRVTLAWWTNWHRDMVPLATAVERGHRVLNFNDGLLYLVLGEASGYRYPTAERIDAAGWHPGLFSRLADDSEQELDPTHPRLGGAYFSVWCDVPDALDPDGLMARLREPLAAFARRARTGAEAP